MSFLTMLPYRNDSNPALRSAIEAVSVAQIGAEFNDQALLKNASSLYRLALGQLGVMLSQSQADEDTLAASLLLTICEVGPCSSLLPLSLSRGAELTNGLALIYLLVFPYCQ